MDGESGCCTDKILKDESGYKPSSLDALFTTFKGLND